MNWSVDRVVQYLTAFTLLAALIRGGYKTWKDHQADKEEIEEALDRQPAIREQLAIGNIKGAVEVLSLANDELSQAMARQRTHYEEELATALGKARECAVRCERLEQHNERLEEHLGNAEQHILALVQVLRKHGIDVPPDIMA